jgi:acyl-CoA thioesterase FadM
MYGHAHVSAQINLLDIGLSRLLVAVFGTRFPDYVAVHYSVDFVSELRLEDRFAECTVSAVTIGSHSMALEHRLATADGRLVSTAHVVLVAWDAAGRTRRAIPPAERAALLQAGAVEKPEAQVAAIGEQAVP